LTKLRNSTASNASKLHRAIGQILIETDYFGNFSLYQEYPVIKVNPNYSSNAHLFDWAIPKLKIIFECHGIQHYHPAQFGGIEAEEALMNFNIQKLRDRKKKNAAEEMGWTYVEVPYTIKVTEQNVIKLFEEAKEKMGDISNISYQESKKKVRTEYEQKRLEFAKEQRRKQYQALKKWKKEHE